MSPEFVSHIQSAGRWLSTPTSTFQGMDVLHGRDDYVYGTGHNSRVGSSESSWRLPLYWFSNINGVDRFVTQIFDYVSGRLPGYPPDIADYRTDVKDGFMAPWAYYATMGYSLSRLG